MSILQDAGGLSGSGADRVTKRDARCPATNRGPIEDGPVYCSTVRTRDSERELEMISDIVVVGTLCEDGPGYWGIGEIRVSLYRIPPPHR
jgi:hypothetical protein